MKRIALIEDDPTVREELALLLENEGYQVLGVTDFAAVPRQVQAFGADLVLLDLGLPGKDGFALCAALRRESPVPIIIVTSRDAALDELKALSLGGDDYITKPYNIPILLARIKAVLRRTRRQENGVLRCGELEVDPAARTVRRGGEPVELTYKEFELLRLLLSRRGSVLTRDEILHAVWDYDFTGETRTVDMHIKSLRQKLGDGLISTVRGVGYKID